MRMGAQQYYEKRDDVNNLDSLIILNWLSASYLMRSGCWAESVHLRPTYLELFHGKAVATTTSIACHFLFLDNAPKCANGSSWNVSASTIQGNERVVPAVSYKLAGWFRELPNAIGKFRKGFRKKIKVYRNGLIRKKNAGIKASCPRVSTANYRLKYYFHGGQPTKYIYIYI